jgi:photosystem II stability/assembly factor-like uncharacterized protein
MHRAAVCIALSLTTIPFYSASDFTLYTCTAVMKEYVVGAKLPPSGLFERPNSREWRHVGFNHPFLFALDYDAHDPATLYLAAGNGLIRAADGGSKWTILTGSDVTELRDVAVDRNASGTIYFAHVAGIRVSKDRGATWRDASGNLRRKYTEALRVDARHAGILLAGTEEGIFRSENGGDSWQLAGAAGFQILHIEQSPAQPCNWLATTEMGGVFASRDCGRSFESAGSIGVGRNLYDLAFDATDPERVAIAGWGFGVAISHDGGKSWQFRNSGLPRTDVWSVAFDPAQPGRMYAAVHEEAVYRSDDAGVHWMRDGQDGSIVLRMKFVPVIGQGESRR